MKAAALIYPMFAMVLLTFGVLVALFRARVRAVRDGQIAGTFFKTYQGVEPASSVKLSRHFANIFEAPNLFYAACLAGMILGVTSYLFLALAWNYVGLRVIHAWIHTGRNKLNPRIAVYLLSWIVLLCMWGYLSFAVFNAQ